MTKIAFIGGGNMGYALAAGVNKALPDLQIEVADPVKPQRERFEAEGIPTTASNSEVVHDASVVVLAVKPQLVEDVTSELQAVITDQLVVSIAAGTPLAKLNALLGDAVPIVRCMPNTPALLGEGITGMLANANVSTDQRTLAESILGVCGMVVWFDSDDELDKVTALSGSGPAYFFYLIESLVAAGESMGLGREAALQLVIQTAVGASAMASQDGSDPSQLRKNVTSPGGTTEAALNHLIRQNIDQEFVAAVDAAYQRAKELAT